jgi:acyl dehydratase
MPARHITFQAIDGDQAAAHLDELRALYSEVGRVRDGLPPSQPREQAAGQACPGAGAAGPVRLGASREYLVDVPAAAPVGGFLAGAAGDALAHVSPSEAGQRLRHYTLGGISSLGNHTPTGIVEGMGGICR